MKKDRPYNLPSSPEASPASEVGGTAAPTNRPHETESGSELLRGWWARIPSVYKALSAIVVFAAVCFGAGIWWIQYVSNYATKSDFDKHVTKSESSEAEIREEIRVLREDAARRESDITSIKKDTSDTREDVRTLLRYMLENPPPRRGGAGR